MFILGKSTKANLDDTIESEDGEIVQYKVTVLTKVTFLVLFIHIQG